MSTVSDLMVWLTRAVRSDGAVNTRYNVISNAWENTIRPDCNTESMLAFALDGSWSRVSAIWAAIVEQQHALGWWTFYEGTETDWWINDNAEVAIHLFKVAELDTGSGAVYRESAFKTCDWLVTMQQQDGQFPYKAGQTASSPMFTAHVMTALAYGYAATDSGTRKAAYLTAIEAATPGLVAKIRGDGRVLTSQESGAGEMWRPPSSDQSIVIRALATCERLCATSGQFATWRTGRRVMLAWLSRCVDSPGAVVNGLGENASGADSPMIVDNVYTTAFAVEAFWLSAELDSSSSYATIARGILHWVAGNVWYSSNPDENGCVRGAYNIREGSWDTRSVITTEEGTDISDSAYTGWSAAPLVARFVDAGMRSYGVGTGTGRRRGLVVVL